MNIDRQVLICQYVNCHANGSEQVLAAFRSQAIPGVAIVASECQGQCNMGPTVRILPDGIWYCRVKPEDVTAIVTEHLQAGKPVDRLLHPRFHPRF